jgi:hypothetical protein
MERPVRAEWPSTAKVLKALLVGAEIANSRKELTYPYNFAALGKSS